MELSDLMTFATVARTQRITAAARVLNTVQSNVTGRIKGLEAEIGLTLFSRHSRGMVLTDAGHRLLPYAERLLSLSREALRAARNDGLPRGELLIGSMETTAALRLPGLLADYHRAYPYVQLSLRTGPTAEMAEAVLERALDCAFVAGPLEHPDLVAHPAFQEELVLVTQRALLSLDAVAGAASNGLAALMFKVGCSYRQRLEQVLAGLGLSVYGRLEFGTLDGILGCVAAGVGVTLLPRAVVEQSAQATALRCHTLEPLHAHVETLLVLRRDAYVGAALLRLMSLVSVGPGDQVT